MSSNTADLVWLRSDHVEVGVATRFGPRVMWFGRPGGENVLADLGDASLDAGEGRRYMLRGGHRLSVGPELPELTYQLDDEPVQTSSDDLIFGGEGQDWLFGEDGDDIVFGDDMGGVLTADFLRDLVFGS